MQFALLLIAGCFKLLQFANLGAEHGGVDLGFFHCTIVGNWGGRRHGRRVGGHGAVERLLGDGCCAAQLVDLGLQLGAGVGCQLLFGLFQGDLGHAGFDLEFFLLVTQSGRFGRCCITASRSGCGLGLRGLGLGCFGSAGLTFGFFLFFSAAQAFLAQLEALLRLLGLELFLLQIANLTLGRAVVLHQGNARRADIGAGAALDAVEQVMRLELFMLLADGEEVQLLRQQAGRTGFGTLTATNARHGRRWRWQLGGGRGQQAVGGLDHGYGEVGQGKAHHRAAHDQAVQLAAVEAGKLQQFTHRGAEQHLDVHRSGQGLTGQGGNARDQRFAVHHRVMDGHASADVLAEHADIRRQATAGHFHAGENLDQLFFATGGVFGGEYFELIAALVQRAAHGGDGFGLIVFDADQHLIRLDQLHQNVDTADHLVGAFAHEKIVGADIGFALGAIDDQRMDLLRWPRVEFHCGGEARTAQTADPCLANQLNQSAAFQVTIVRLWRQCDPFIQPIAVDDDGWSEHARDMRVRLRADKTHGARGRRMHGHADKTIGGGDQLAFQYALTHGDHRFCGRADMLVERQRQALGQRRRLDRRAVGQLLALGRMNAAGDIPDTFLRTHAACSRSLAINWPGAKGFSHFQLCTVLPTSIMSMQSTGQGSTHRSQPVHSLTITVCICLAAPTMASTGHA